MAFFGKLGNFMMHCAEVFFVTHCSVSVVSTAGLYVAIRDNVDVEALLEKVGHSGVKADNAAPAPPADPTVILDGIEKKKNRMVELEASRVGALALAILYDQKLGGVQLPITITLMPFVARFLRARNISL